MTSKQKIVAIMAACIVAISLFYAWKWLKPTVPKTLVIAAGAKSGAYAQYADQYAKLLAADGVKLEVRYTNGSVENIAALRDLNSDVQIAMLQTGIAGDTQVDSIVALGSLFYEPLWVFYKPQASGKNVMPPIEKLTALQGMRIGVGAAGSGTLPVATALLAANGVNEQNSSLQKLASADAAKALLAGELDAVMIIASSNAPVVNQLLAAPNISLMNMSTAEAYSRHMPALSKIMIPKGLMNLVQNLPATDIQTLAATATLVAKDDVHPAVLYLLVKAVKEVHGGGSLLHAQREFPSISKFQEFDIPESVEQQYKNGTPVLYRYLPFWLANLVMRLWVLLIPLGAILVSASDMVPKLLGLRMTQKITKIYQNARALEDEIIAYAGNKNADRMLVEAANTAFSARLARLYERTDALKGPGSMVKTWYELRSHLELVAGRIAGLK